MATDSRTELQLVNTSDVHEAASEVEMESGNWYVSTTENGEMTFSVPSENVNEDYNLCFDILQTGENMSVFELLFTEGSSDSLLQRVPELIWSRANEQFAMNIRVLVGCTARVNISLGELMRPEVKRTRHGAWLTSFLGGNQISPEKIDEVVLRIKTERRGNTKWWMSTPYVTEATPPPLTNLTMTNELLLDEFGQSAVHSSEYLIKSETELVESLHSQETDPTKNQWPDDYSEWGGRSSEQLKSTGYFTTRYDGDQWWFVDPDGFPFWSSGITCVDPTIESAYKYLEDGLKWLPPKTGKFEECHIDTDEGQVFNYLTANLIRAFGPDEWYKTWKRIVASEVLDMGFNTVGAWSDEAVPKEFDIPYVRSLDWDFGELPEVYSDFPDVYHPDFESTVEEYAKPLQETADDPALLGYFLSNYPDWTLIQSPIAEKMITTEGESYTQDKLADTLRETYGDSETLSTRWGTSVSFEDIQRGTVAGDLSETAKDNLNEFSTRMVERLYATKFEKCRQFDENHLNLGVRFAESPPEWAEICLKYTDVFTIYSYSNSVSDSNASQRIAELVDKYDVPALIGEWQFGALDSSLPSPGLCPLATQEERGDAFRNYLESAAAEPWCVGAHYFRLYDHSAIGGTHGENFNIGLLNTCNQKYEEVTEAARESHESLYSIVSGRTAPFDDPPEYL